MSRHHELASLREVTFPGRAGTLQKARDWDGLAAELAASYEQYSAYLAKRLADLGPEPDPEEYRRNAKSPLDTLKSYGRACAARQEILRAEVILRDLRAGRLTGRDFTVVTKEAFEARLALVEGPMMVDGRLVPADTPRPATESPSPDRDSEPSANMPSAFWQWHGRR